MKLSEIKDMIQEEIYKVYLDSTAPEPHTGTLRCIRYLRGRFPGHELEEYKAIVEGAVAQMEKALLSEDTPEQINPMVYEDVIKLIQFSDHDWQDIVAKTHRVLQTESMIPAIKQLRNLTGYGWRASTFLVDELIATGDITQPE